jgi:hypothetical protein
MTGIFTTPVSRFGAGATLPAGQKLSSEAPEGSLPGATGKSASALYVIDLLSPVHANIPHALNTC